MEEVNERSSSETNKCKLCNFGDCDVDILSCGCSFHARCLPTKIFRSGNRVQYNQDQSPQELSGSCPSCLCPIEEIYLYPLSMSYLDQASAHNQNSLHGKKSGSSKKEGSPNISAIGKVRKRSNSGPQDPDVDSAANIAAITAPYLVWSKRSVECSDNDKLHFRTGRWNSAETDYVDCLTSKFDMSALNLPHGIKLNEFLRDMLMCKSSRLTKKFKNAKLSTKLYQIVLNDSLQAEDHHSAIEFGRLQENFLNSLSDVTHLILRFNMSRMWRQHLFNTCLQGGYEKLQTGAWLKSVDEFEKKVAESEQSLRRVRRRRMEFAFREDSKSMKGQGADINLITATRARNVSNVSNVESSPMKRDTNTIHNVAPKVTSAMFEIPVLPPIMSEQTIANSAPDPTPIDQLKVMASGHNTNFPVTIEVQTPTTENDEFSFDFLAFDDMKDNNDIYLHDSNGDSDPSESSSSQSFVSGATSYVQKEDLPFHCVELWVPGGISFDQFINLEVKKGISLSKEKTQLIHAGYGTRSDLPPLAKLQLDEFCVYSRNFIFDNGAGMPGRVFRTTRYSWETNIQEASPEYFKRVAAAKMCNVRTAVGIPIEFPNNSRVVLGFYSIFDLIEDPMMVKKIVSHCQKFIRLPKSPFHKSVPSSIDTMISNVVSKASLEDAQDCSESLGSNASDLTSANSTARKVEVISAKEINDIANLLAAHMPIPNYSAQATEGASSLDKFISLRLVLLRYPIGCTEDQKRCLLILKRSYEGYLRVMMKSYDIAHMLVKDWAHLNGSCQQPSSPVPVPWGAAIAHVDYSRSESNNNTQENPLKSHMPGSALSPPSILLPPSVVTSSPTFSSSPRAERPFMNTNDQH